MSDDRLPELERLHAELGVVGRESLVGWAVGEITQLRAEVSRLSRECEQTSDIYLRAVISQRESDCRELRAENVDLRRQLDDVAALATARLMCREKAAGGTDDQRNTNH